MSEQQWYGFGPLQQPLPDPKPRDDGALATLGIVGGILLVLGVLFMSRMATQATMGIYGLVMVLLGGQAVVGALIVLGLRK